MLGYVFCLRSRTTPRADGGAGVRRSGFWLYKVDGLNFDDFLALFRNSTNEEEKALPVSPIAPPMSAEAKPLLRPCDFNPDHPAYAAVWLPANRTRAGRWVACPLCKQEWLEQVRRDQRLLNLLPGEPVWTKQSFR